MSTEDEADGLHARNEKARQEFAERVANTWYAGGLHHQDTRARLAALIANELRAGGWTPR